MTSIKPGNKAGHARNAIPAVLILIVTGLAGNYFKFSILNADFIFGSIFAILAFQFFGFVPGVFSACVIASYTYIAWNHPFALITMTAEMAIVGWLTGRRNMNLVMADAFYWLLIGIPIGLFLFYFIADLTVTNALFLMTKQGLNGIVNALVARLIYTGFPFRTFKARISFRELLSNLLVFFVLFPSVTLLVLSAKADLAETDRQIRSELISDSHYLTERLGIWVENRKTPIMHLANLATTLSSSQIQTHLDQTRLSDQYFEWIALLDSESTVIAEAALLHEIGQSNIGKILSDRAFIPTLKRTLLPMLSDVVIENVGTSKPMVAILAPVFIHSEFGGYVIGSLNLDKIDTIIQDYLSGRKIEYSLLDKYRTVIVTSHEAHYDTTLFSRSQGALTLPDEYGIAQWIPRLPRNTSTIDLWGKSFFVRESIVEDLAEWKLILEQPVLPFQKQLYETYTGKIFMLFIILLVSQLLAELLSRRILQPIDKLRKLTQDLPAKLVPTQQIVWPKSFSLETDHLIVNFKEMADALRDKFIDIGRVNESLEERIKTRTEELQKSEAFIKDIVENIPDMVFVKDAADLRFVQINRAGEEMLGFSRDELIGKNDYDLFPREQAEIFVEKDREVLLSGKLVDIPEEIIQTRNQGSRIFHTKKIPLNDSNGVFCFLLGLSEDITEQKHRENALQEANRKLQVSQVATLNILEDLKQENLSRAKSEAEIRRLNTELEQRVIERTAQLETTNKELEAFSYSVSHDLRAPLRHISGYVDLLISRFQEALPEKASHYLYEVKDSAQQMGILIDDLLQFSRTGRQNLQRTDFDMSTVVQEILAKLKTDTKSRNISWIIANLPRVSGDQSMIKQVWANLLENAVKFTQYKSEAEIEVGSAREPGQWVFFVRDNGAGFDMTYAHKLFGVFQRLHPYSQFEGTGIGLANVQRIIQKHNGRVWADAQPEKGASFYFTVPDNTFEDGVKS